ncbi:MAG: hypothetical protein K5945_00335 [Bacteroidaceae bacterium]|nr:hypothetical protein [Bacteroidaceae bacterium]
MRTKLLRACASALLCCAFVPLWAIEAVDGVYQIGSQDDLKAFAEIVNSGENPSAFAVLTADIVIDDSGLIISPTNAQTYKGEFDGQGHTITFDNVSWISPNTASSDATGLFGHLAGKVSNLRLEGVINAGGVRMAPLAGRLEGATVFKNIISNVTIKNSVIGDTAASLLVSRPSAGSSQIINCMALGGIFTTTGSNAGGLVGWNPNDVITTIENSAMLGVMQVAPTSATTPTDLVGRCLETNAPIVLKNVYYTTHAENTNVERIWKGALPVTAEAVMNGELCYLLNGDQSLITWYQTLGSDAYPVLDKTHLVVCLKTDGTYYNEGGEGISLATLARERAIVNVYDMQGRVVRSDVKADEALQGLPSGLYVIGGKKVVNK